VISDSQTWFRHVVTISLIRLWHLGKWCLESVVFTHRCLIRQSRSLFLYIDLQIFVEEIREGIKVDEIKDACDDLVEDIEEMIVAVGTTMKTEGKVLSVGIYFPSGHNQVSQSRLDMYEEVDLGCWVDFLVVYYTARGHL